MHKERWGFLLLIPILAAALVWALHTDDVRNARLRIGATYMTMNNPFYSVIDEELRLMIEIRGYILLTRDPALSQERQNEQIRDLLREHVDLLVVNPVDFLGVTPALEDAQAAGVHAVPLFPIIIMQAYSVQSTCRARGAAGALFYWSIRGRSRQSIGLRVSAIPWQGTKITRS